MNKKSIWMNDIFIKNPELKFLENSLCITLEILISAFSNKNKLLVCGNGGSATDSSHIVAELMKGFRRSRRLTVEQQSIFEGFIDQNIPFPSSSLQGGLPAISLCENSGLITAIANDTFWEMVFAQQIYALGKTNDVLLVISTSGNSLNVVYAAWVAKQMGIKVIGLTGINSGRLDDLCDICLKVPSSNTARIQEYHELIYHELCGALEEHFFQ